MNREYLFSSESVSEGHPDKVADQISDAVLDAYLREDSFARVACETLIAKNLVVVAGEFKAKVRVSIPEIVRETIKSIGYTDKSCGFDYRSCKILTSTSEQSDNIAAGIERPDCEFGAGDQGMMFGYATNETPDMMPLAITLAHKLMMRHAELRKNGSITWLRPDAKSQVTVRYRGGKPIRIEKVVLSAHHSSKITSKQIEEKVVEEIIEKVISPDLRSNDMQCLVNPAGRFEIGGPEADVGLTGRKTIVDTYGGSCPHGGGAFSGKDPTKVDRSAAYMARYIAKNVVAAGLSERCTVQLAYAIGMVEPVSLMVDLHGTGSVTEKKLEDVVRQIFSLSPGSIIDSLFLRRPIYQKTAVYGHFGRVLPEFTWEKTDKANELRNYFNL
ncbi:methionine adenosyltransferase [Chloroflexota bacterium]